MKRGMYSPDILRATNEPARPGKLHAVLPWGHRRQNRTQGRAQRLHVSCQARCERLVTFGVDRRERVLLVAQLDGLDVIRVPLRVDRQNPPSRITLALRREEGGREFHLART